MPIKPLSNVTGGDLRITRINRSQIWVETLFALEGYGQTAIDLNANCKWDETRSKLMAYGYLRTAVSICMSIGLISLLLVVSPTYAQSEGIDLDLPLVDSELFIGEDIFITTYDYDSLGRLHLTEHHDGAVDSVDYDDAGNRIHTDYRP